MKDDYDRMNEYATKGGYEAGRFLMANIKAGQTALLRRSFLTDRITENLRYLFYDDADKAKEPLNFLCAQAWSAAVEGGVKEKDAGEGSSSLHRVYFNIVLSCAEVGDP